ncbi:MAG: LysR family transcriptional regulator [Oceanospirillaceae bacterium]|jgi:DNA-binding transcriptional LysR family regulator|nr:LysR family transcriptional regulator [Oceanospirillaceae bacterium]MBT5629701.1 LysR family transcriptional regulator [Oceanospirillaceae bacterium]MDC1424959.1 LysR family transcriptional regulator [Oceanospirillaceae bacterium]MDO7573764.1 LysR family transcriptional regulator [Oceanospirillaceae bacterium]
MELKWLEDLLALLEEKSITRAAERRHVTQPAYSRRVKQIEDWLGVELVNRATKPVNIRPIGLAMEADVRDLVNRFYALRNKAHENQNKITFIAQHTLSVSRIPQIIRDINALSPKTSFRVMPANNNGCQNLFLKEGGLLLCYQNSNQPINFTQASIAKIKLGNDYLLPVVSRELAIKMGPIKAGMRLPILMYPKGGFLAECLAQMCLPRVFRDYRVELVCESAFSASLKEMVLGSMGIAWLAKDLIQTELENDALISLEDLLGSVMLDVLLFCKEDEANDQVTNAFNMIGSF